eukprot:360874-Chlamydomonas_euryale.AAC.3
MAFAARPCGTHQTARTARCGALKSWVGIEVRRPTPQQARPRALLGGRARPHPIHCNLLYIHAETRRSWAEAGDFRRRGREAPSCCRGSMGLSVPCGQPGLDALESRAPKPAPSNTSSIRPTVNCRGSIATYGNWVAIARAHAFDQSTALCQAAQADVDVDDKLPISRDDPAHFQGVRDELEAFLGRGAHALRMAPRSAIGSLTSSLDAQRICCPLLALLSFCQRLFRQQRHG